MASSEGRYPEGVTSSDHIAHDMRRGRFPERSSVETFLAERESVVPDYWERIRGDTRLANARRKLSMDELRMLFQHARDSVECPPKPAGETVRLTADPVPYSSVVGGGLVLKKMNGQAGFIVNFIGTTEGVTKEECSALSQQFAWFVQTYGCYVPARALTKDTPL